MAATSITPLSAPFANSPYSVSLHISGDDFTSPGTWNLLTPTTIAAGPLQALLRRTPDWTVFNPGGVKCGAIHVRTRQAQGGVVGAVAVRFVWLANSLRAAIAGNAGAGTCIVEIRLSHTERY